MVGVVTASSLSRITETTNGGRGDIEGTKSIPCIDDRVPLFIYQIEKEHVWFIFLCIFSLDKRKVAFKKQYGYHCMRW